MNIGVIIVTYNRIEKLKIALDSFAKQSFLPKYVLVVNNHSTDNTEEYLKEWNNIDDGFDKYIINTETNLGGSGGFFIGQEEALKLDADWIWFSDDDAYPDIDALEKANEFLEKYEYKEMLAAICGKVINNGKIHYAHRRNLKKRLFNVKIIKSEEEDYKKDFFEINLFSYVGTIINKNYLLEYGLVNKNYFIYYDDTEHSYRLSKNGKILCVPNITITHDIWDNKVTECDWRTYYSIRNNLIFIKTVSKRYFFYNYLKLKIKLSVKKIINYKPYSLKLIETAIKDAKNDKLGKNEIYKPGWKPGK